MLEIKKFVVNPVQENTFLLYDQTKECILVDAGFYDPEEEKEADNFMNQNGLTLKKLVNTHCHFDHMMGIEYMRNKYHVEFAVHPDEAFWVEKVVDQAMLFGFTMNPVRPPDRYLSDKDTLTFGQTELRILHVPGHSPGHIVLYEEKQQILIGGDVLFYGSIGRTDLPGGDYHTLINAIKTKLFTLPDHTVVYCGHGPETTLGFEKKHNPFLT
jgi:hydroxyacylglutathione hydrolase